MTSIADKLYCLTQLIKFQGCLLADTILAILLTENYCLASLFTEQKKNQSEYFPVHL